MVVAVAVEQEQDEEERAAGGAAAGVERIKREGPAGGETSRRAVEQPVEGEQVAVKLEH